MSSNDLDHLCEALARRNANGCAKLSRLDFIEVDVPQEHLCRLRALVSEVVIQGGKTVFGTSALRLIDLVILQALIFCRASQVVF